METPTYILFYTIIILGLIILTNKKHNLIHKEDFSMMSPKIKYSKNKDKCLLAFTDKTDQLKACKKYVKCKYKCDMNLSDSKKCKKKCDELKMNIFRDNENKMRKYEMKKLLKKEYKENKKIEKIKELQKEDELKNNENKNTNKSQSYFYRIINSYMPEADKIYLINLNKGSRKFKKDFKKIFSKYFN